nr:putative polyprotein [Uzakla insect virus]
MATTKRISNATFKLSFVKKHFDEKISRPGSRASPSLGTVPGISYALVCGEAPVKKVSYVGKYVPIKEERVRRPKRSFGPKVLPKQWAKNFLKNNTRESIKIFRDHLHDEEEYHARMASFKEAKKILSDVRIRHSHVLQEHAITKAQKIYRATFESPVEEDKPGVARPTGQKQRKVKRVIPESGPFRGDDEVVSPPPQKKRLSLLLNYLSRTTCGSALAEGIFRMWLKQVVTKRPQMTSQLQEVIDMMSVEPQMDTVHGDPEAATVIQRGNVVLENAVQPTVSTGDADKNMGFLKLASASESQTFEQMANRWLRVGSAEWKTTMEVNTDVLTLKLPFDAIINNMQSPNIMPYLVHRYGRFNMSIRIQVNSNKLQVGSLQCSWMYGAHMNENFKYYNNIFSASQRTHCLINAGSSNEAILEIPYWNFLSLINLKENESERAEGSMPLTLGVLSIKVLNQLTAALTVSPKAHVTVLLAFSDVQLRGMLDRDIDQPRATVIPSDYHVEPQMNDIVKMAERGLKIVGSIANMDYPTSVVPAVSIQPTAAQSLSITDNSISVLQPLRSNPAAQTPSVTNEALNGELRDILNRWSLIGFFSWADSDEEGKLLFNVPAAPLLPHASYDLLNSTGLVRCMPIIAAVSSMFRFWRGDLELRLDFIANTFHNGRIMMAVVPGHKKSVTIDQAKNSCHMIHSIEDNHQMIFRVPYYNKMPFSKVGDGIGDDFFEHVSSIYAFVYNPLVITDNIPNKIPINVYIRAADNFELAILKSPSLALPFNTKVEVPVADKCQIDPKWAAVFIANSRWLYDPVSKKFKSSFFYNETTDYFTQFLNMEFGEIYLIPKTLDSKDIEILYYNNTETAVVTHIARCKEYPNYPVCVVFDSVDSAKQYVVLGDISKAIHTTKQGPWARINNGTAAAPVWEKMTAKQLTSLDFIKIEVGGVEPQMDDQVKTFAPEVSLDPPALTTSFGETVFGERILDFKSACRRFQFYGCLKIANSEVSCLSDRVPICKIQCHPIRTFSVSSSSQRDNRLRDGLISLVSSAYTGYRGGLRFKCILNGATSFTASFGVVHKFDEPYHVNETSVSLWSGSVNSACFYDTAYSACIQSSFVNNVLEFEIPYYSRAEYNSLYYPKIANKQIIDNFYSLGNVYIYYTGTKVENITLDVYYSVADDFQFANFQGFPALLPLTMISPEPQMDDEPKETQRLIPKKDLEEAGPSTVYKPTTEQAPKEKSVKDKIFSEYLKVPDCFGSVTDFIKSQFGKLGQFITELIEGFSTKLKSGVVDKLKSLCSEAGMSALNSFFSTHGGTCLFVLTELIHVVMNPCQSTVIIALTGLLCYFLVTKGHPSSIFLTIQSKLTQCYNLYCRSKNKHVVSEAGVEPQSSFESEDVPVISSLLWSITTSAVGVVNKEPKGLCDSIKCVLKESSGCFRSHSFGLRFFKDILSIFQKCAEWLNKEVRGTENFYQVAENDKALTDWLLHAAVLTSPENVDLCLSTKEWGNKLIEYQVLGRMYATSVRVSTDLITKSLADTILNYQKKMTEILEQIIKKKQFYPLRIEPIVIWVSGSPGCGKTTMCERLISELAKQLKISPDFYSMTMGQAYFDLLKTQKFVYIDDMLSLGKCSDMSVLYAQYLSMCSTAPLSLPRSRVEDKATLDNFEFLLCSSMSKDWEQTGVAHSEAYNRRSHIRVEIQCPENINTAKVDYGDISWKDRLSYRMRTHNTMIECDYEEILQAVVAKAIEYHRIAVKRYYDRIAIFNDIAERAATTSNSFFEYFTNFKQNFDKSFENYKKQSIDFEADKQNINWLTDKLNLYFKDEAAPVEPQMADSEYEETEEEVTMAPDEMLNDAMSDNAANNRVEEKRFHCPLVEYQKDFDELPTLLLHDAPNPLERRFMRDVFRTSRSINLIDRHPCIHKSLLQGTPVYATLDPDYIKAHIPLIYQHDASKGLFVDANAFGTPFIRAAWAVTCGSNCEYGKRFFDTRLSKLIVENAFIVFGKKTAIHKNSIKYLVPPSLYGYVKPHLPILSAYYSVGIKRSLQRIVRVHKEGKKYATIVVKGVVHNSTIPISQLSDAMLVKSHAKTIDEAKDLPKPTDWPETMLQVLVILSCFMFILAMLSLLVSLIIEIWDICYVFFSKEPQISASGDHFQGPKVNASVRAAQLVQASPNLNTAAPSRSDGIKKRIKRNMFYLMLVKNHNQEGEKYLDACCLGLYNQYCIVLNHYLDHFQYLTTHEKGWELFMVPMYSMQMLPLRFSDLKIFKMDKGGYSVCKLPPNWEQFRDIRKYMSFQHDIKVPSTCELMKHEGNDVKYVIVNAKFITSKFSVPAKGKMDSWDMQEYIEYNIGGKGFCGSLLLSTADVNAPLLGIHTAGAGSAKGFAELLLRDSFDFDEIPITIAQPEMNINPNKPMPKGPHFQIGHVEAAMSVKIPSETRIIPSLLYDEVLPHKTEPAPLTPSDSRLNGESPLWTAVENRCNPPLDFEDEILEEAVKDYKNLILTKCVPITASVRKLTIEESIEGVENIKYMDPLTLSTSEGYPWTKMRKGQCTGKRWLIDVDYSNAYPKVVKLNSMLKETIELKDNMRSKNIIPATYFTACLKDARLPIEKCSVPGKTRLFEMSPIDLTIAQRQYFLTFYASFMNCKFDLEHTIGINTNSNEWSFLAWRLSEFSDNIVAGDYSKYGPRLMKKVAYKVWDIMCDWLAKFGTFSELEILSARNMKFECLNSILIIGSYCMRSMCGLDSGNPATVILNSMVNSIYIRVAFLKITNLSLYHFHKNVVLFTNGDDLIMAVSDNFKEKFNNVLLSKFFAQYNIKYTNEKKQDTCLAFESLYDVSYLKCQFRHHPFRVREWLAALDKTSIEDCFQWIWKTDLDPVEATVANCEQAIRLSYGHGKEYFNWLSNLLSSALERRGIRSSFPSWEDLDSLIWDEDGLLLCFRSFLSVN